MSTGRAKDPAVTQQQAVVNTRSAQFTQMLDVTGLVRLCTMSMGTQACGWWEREEREDSWASRVEVGDIRCMVIVFIQSRHIVHKREDQCTFDC